MLEHAQEHDGEKLARGGRGKILIIGDDDQALVA
jgi:hypothetical protein